MTERRRSVAATLSHRLIPLLRTAVDEGADAFRLNVGYGDEDLVRDWAEQVRRVGAGGSRPCTVLADLGGHKPRLAGGAGIPVAPGDGVLLVAEGTPGAAGGPAAEDRRTAAVRDRWIFSELRPGDDVQVGDGETVLRVERVGTDQATTTVRRGEVVEPARGLTVPGRSWRSGATDTDLARLEQLARRGLADAVLVSFVEGGEDLDPVRSVLRGAARGEGVAVIAKVETAAGVAALPAIAGAADMVMIGRGDLALSLPWVELFDAVVTAVDHLEASGTRWWIATDCMLGAEQGGMPTRAEICDLAHWVRRGAHGVLLSHETVFGADVVNPIRCARAVVDHYADVTA